MPEFIFTMRAVTKVHPPDKKVLDNIHLAFYPGAKIGVIGANGSGKSSLMRIMAGIDKTHGGDAIPHPGTKIGYFAQEPDMGSAKTVGEAVAEGVAETQALLTRFEEIGTKLGEPMDEDAMNALLEEQAKLQDEIDAKDAWNLDRHVELAMHALRVPSKEAEIAVLSGGEKRRVALCRLLLSRPDMLLLDEPTNHLDAESVLWLEQFLHEYPGTVVAVTHDRYFLDNVAGWILELDHGRGYPFEGNYSGWLEKKAARLAQEEKTESARRRKLRQELDWVRSSPRARQAKSKARLAAYEDLLASSQKVERDQADITIPPGPRLGDVVIEADDLEKKYGDKILMGGLSFILPRSGIVGVIGPNGAGKTTLFRMVVGQEKPDAGTIKLGETVKISYVDQSRDALAGDKSVWDVITGGAPTITLGKREVNSRTYCTQFNFKGSDQQKKVKDLSGGERNRVHLARLLKDGGNLLLLDEPTNDLDVETLQSLEDALLAFPGCAVVISHDRWFLNRIATHILAFEGDGKVTWFAGNFDDYEEDKKKRLGGAADKPKKFRKLDG
jgi:ATP-binding cassette ChvD family protein